MAETPEALPTTLVYVIYDDGSIETQTITGSGMVEPVLDKPGRVTSEAEYKQYLAVLEERQSIYVAEQTAAEQSALKGDYDALRAAGIPEETARRITGYTGP